MNERLELDAADHQRIQEFFKEQKVAGACPACGNGQWVVFDHLVITPVWQGYERPVDASLGYPAVVVCCRRCGYLRSHSAFLVGVLPAKPGATGGNDGR